MPWKVVANYSGCPSSKPFGVVNSQTGRKVACHTTKADAQKQVVALYVNVPDSGASMSNDSASASSGTTTVTFPNEVRQEKPDPGSFATQDPNGDGNCDHCGQPNGSHKGGAASDDGRAVGTIGGGGISNLPDSAFAYIEPGGTKDDQGKTTPRSLRHFPIKDANGKCDAAHVRNALSRAPQSPFGSKALPKINACARQLGIGQPAANAGIELPTDDLVRAMYPGPQVGHMSWREKNGDPPTDSGARTMHGHFAVFDTWSEINSLFEGTFMERIAPGAFKRTFKNNRESIKAIFQHGRDPQIGDKPIGTINRLEEDARGAAYDVGLLDAPYVRDIVLPGLEAGVYGASFRFRVTQEEMNNDPGESEWNPKGLPERTIKEAAVREFGPVTYPAYPEATAGVRSMTDDYVVSTDDLLRSITERVRAQIIGNDYAPDGMNDDPARSCGCGCQEHQEVEPAAPDQSVTAGNTKDRDYLAPRKETPTWRLP